LGETLLTAGAALVVGSGVVVVLGVVGSGVVVVLGVVGSGAVVMG